VRYVCLELSATFLVLLIEGYAAVLVRQLPGGVDGEILSNVNDWRGARFLERRGLHDATEKTSWPLRNGPASNRL
jgi:hypothetical protein